MKRQLFIILGTVSLAPSAPAMQRAALHAADLQLTTAEDRSIEGSLKALVTGGNPPYKFIDNKYTFGHSTLQLNSDGTFIFTPFAHFIGRGSFQYKAIDSSGASSNVGTVYINIEDYY